MSPLATGRLVRNSGALRLGGLPAEVPRDVVLENGVGGGFREDGGPFPWTKATSATTKHEKMAIPTNAFQWLRKRPRKCSDTR
jgi:hypothetical protein